jgi:hypothetical protein
MKSDNNAGNIHITIHLADAPLLQPSHTGYARNFAHAIEIRDSIGRQFIGQGLFHMINGATIQACELATFTVEKWKFDNLKWVKVI